MNVEKLTRLRDAHAQLHGDYIAAASRYRDAVADTTRLRLECAADPGDEHAAALLALPAEKLAATPLDEIEAARLDARIVRRVLDAHRRAARLCQDADALGSRLRDSRLMLDRLNAYAARFGE